MEKISEIVAVYNQLKKVAGWFGPDTLETSSWGGFAKKRRYTKRWSPIRGEYREYIKEKKPLISNETSAKGLMAGLVISKMFMDKRRADSTALAKAKTQPQEVDAVTSAAPIVPPKEEIVATPKKKIVATPKKAKARIF